VSTKLIGGVILALVLFGGWGLYKYWETFENKKQAEQKEAATKVVVPSQLPGMPSELQQSLDAAQKAGPVAFGNWLRTYGRSLQDPRKAWIELDYCVMLARIDPSEARRIFAEVKQRTSASSPVWPRIQELQQSYE
jgi:hypothetical protein